MSEEVAQQTQQIQIASKKSDDKEPVEAEDYDFLRFIVADFHGIARCKVITKSAYPHMKSKVIIFFHSHKFSAFYNLGHYTI